MSGGKQISIWPEKSLFSSLDRVSVTHIFDGGFTFEWIHNTKEQIYFYERLENHKAPLKVANL